MKKIIIYILILLMTGCANKPEQITEQSVNIELGKIGEEDTISRAQASKMLSLMRYNIAEVEAMERKIAFEDCKAENWYDKYVNACTTEGLMSGASEKLFVPEGYLTLLQTQYLIEKIDSTSTINIKYDNKNKDKPIAYSMWIEAFKKAVPDLSAVGMQEIDIVIIADGDNCEELGDRYVMTNKGLYSMEGYDIKAYINKEIRAIVKENEIVAITEFVNNQPTILQAEVTEVGQNGLRVKIAGCERYYNFVATEINVGDKINIKINGNTIVEATK